jgi:hypothetical protein
MSYHKVCWAAAVRDARVELADLPRWEKKLHEIIEAVEELAAPGSDP